MLALLVVEEKQFISFAFGGSGKMRHRAIFTQTLLAVFATNVNHFHRIYPRRVHAPRELMRPARWFFEEVNPTGNPPALPEDSQMLECFIDLPGWLPKSPPHL
jgi:hypothetical protein